MNVYVPMKITSDENLENLLFMLYPSIDAPNKEREVELCR